MQDSNYIKIFTGSFIIVQRMLHQLKAIDISGVVKDLNESGLDPKIYGGASHQEIYVHNDELDAAVEVVQSIQAEMEA